MNHRQLSPEEINQLTINGCTALDWSRIKAADGFNPALISKVNFIGDVNIGLNTRIENVFELAGYSIEDNVIIQNVNSLTIDGETSFGNGTKISVLNEGGGRELIMYDKLSSQTAYMLVTCRHDPEFIDKLEKLILNYCAGKKSNTGLIGHGTKIRNSAIIKNVWIEGPAEIEAASNLSGGTIVSCSEDPVKIGTGVNAKHFIIQSGTVVSDGVLLDNCFLGQGVRIGKQYSAENCAFFSNCEAYHGEGVSVFAGPYTVTHHKSSLLIAAMFSFYNAGSGTNQSNHMYKLGPLHQGILERGSKTGSFSYMLMPSRVGAYSVVIGKHYTNFDAGNFPFSYINEEEGKSLLTPAMNMFTVGTRRDTQKWRSRDRRKDPEKYDILNFELFNPYIIAKVNSAITVMKELSEKANKEQEYVTYKGLHIKRLLLKTCMKYYEMAVKIFIGQEIIKRMGSNQGERNLRNALNYNAEQYSEKWVDAAGMFLPKNQYAEIMNGVRSGEIKKIGELQERFNKLNAGYQECSWAWCAKLIESRMGKAIAEISKDQAVQIITEWRDNTIKLNNMILKDAEKEFDQASKIGFGVDGDQAVQEADFESVRGRYEDNGFVKELKKENEEILLRCEGLLTALKQMPDPE